MSWPVSRVIDCAYWELHIRDNVVIQTVMDIRKNKRWEHKAIIAIISYIINFAYWELNIGDNIISQMVIDRRWWQILRMQVMKYGYRQRHKSNTWLSNKRTKLRLLLQINSLKLGKTTVRQNYWMCLWRAVMWIIMLRRYMNDNVEEIALSSLSPITLLF